MKKIIILIALAFCLNGKAQIVTTLAGSTTAGSTNGTGAAASFKAPVAVCTDGMGNLFVADYNNNLIRKIIISTGVVTTLAGSTTPGFADGTGAAATFDSPAGLVADGLGNLYVADASNNEIRKIVISTGVVTTIAGSHLMADTTNGIDTAARFNSPHGLAIDGNGNLYVADTGNNEIRKIVTSSGVVTTFAGSTIPGSTNGTGTAARFSDPVAITADGSGNLYVADLVNEKIREIVISTRIVTTLAGSNSTGSANGTGTAASFNFPSGVAVDGSGNLYVADANNNEIRKIVISTGVVTTLAGTTTAGSANGTGVAASLKGPNGVATDASGNLYVADTGNDEIRAISLSTGAGIEEFADNKGQINIYPNPNNGSFVIEPNSAIKQTLQVYDVNGKLVLNQTINGKTTIDASSLNEGVYNISLTSNEGVVNKRVVIVK
jgi:sugar lactone lactonase YvrE